MAKHLLVLDISTVNTAPAHGAIARLAAALGAPPTVVLNWDFFTEAARLLEYADHQLREGESLDLDELAQLLAAYIRPNLQVVYGHREGGGGAQAGPLGPSTGDTDAVPSTSSAAPVVPS